MTTVMQLLLTNYSEVLEVSKFSWNNRSAKFGPRKVDTLGTWKIIDAKENSWGNFNLYYWINEWI